MQRPSGKPTRRGDASETESLSSLDYEGGAPSADFVHASFQGGSGMRGATMAGGGDSGFLTTTGNNVVGPTSVRPEVRFSLLFTLFMGGFVQLFGFNCQLAYSVFLGREVLVSNGEKNREWAALALFPYAGLAVAGALLYLTTVSLRARKGLELAQAATTTPGRSSANEDSDAAEQSSMLQPRTSASEGERRVETAILSGCSFHLRFFLALSLMGLSFVPVMTLAVHYRSLTCAILSMALNGLAQAWLTGCLVGLCAALENPKTMVAYNLGNAAAAWPTAILGIVFVVQKQFQPSVVYCQVVFGLCAFSCLAYYFAYFSVLRPYAQSTDEIAVALRQVEENQLEFFPGARNGESADGFPLARDGSFSTGTAAAQKLPAQRSSGEEPASRSQEKEQQIKKAAVAVGSGAGDLAHIGSAPGKNNIQRTFCELVCASWQIITAMLLHFLFTFIVFPGVSVRWRRPVNVKLTDEQLWQMLLAIFIVFDTFGRYTPQWVPLPARFLLLAVVVRGVLLLPAFFLFPFYQVGLEWHIVIMIFFAWTQGHLTTNIFIHSGEHAISYREVGLLGPTVSAALVMGLLAGSSMQFGISTALPPPEGGAPATPSTGAGNR
mmetsp:Transcript_24869/g.62553  ORF Transcript_24869/g.62553 Transcript_24869/m.62553 type:complete len:608 (+) Transcript_24869:191-2014(+)|eukprot:g403.t1